MPAPINNNTSATGGPLVPASSPAPLEGLELNQFLAQLVAGVTNLDPTLVRPRYQAEPPVIPAVGTAWCAVGSQNRRSETFAYIKHNADGNGSDELQRSEELDVLCSFYDLGTTGIADYYAAILRDGLEIEQNQEVLRLVGMQLVAPPSEARAIPTLLHQRWRYRVDAMFQIRRRVRRRYPVLTLLSGRVILHANEADARTITQEIDINP